MRIGNGLPAISLAEKRFWKKYKITQAELKRP